MNEQNNTCGECIALGRPCPGCAPNATTEEIRHWILEGEGRNEQMTKSEDPFKPEGMTNAEFLKWLEDRGEEQKFNVEVEDRPDGSRLYHFTVVIYQPIPVLELLEQLCKDLNQAHDTIVKLQSQDNARLDRVQYDWPEWTPQANSIRMAERILGKKLAKTNQWTLYPDNLEGHVQPGKPQPAPKNPPKLPKSKSNPKG